MCPWVNLLKFRQCDNMVVISCLLLTRALGVALVVLLSLRAVVFSYDLISSVAGAVIAVGQCRQYK